MGLPCDWQTTKQRLSQRGQYILETGQWSDCKFIVGQEPHQQILEGHKLVLAMSSPVFEAMFFGGMAEKNDPIPIRDVQPEAFKALLEYIYTDSIELTCFELACELCYCAKKYMLPFLVEECTQYLWSDLSPKKACRAYEFAKLFEEPILMAKCLQIICLKTNIILKESSWEEIELATLLVILEQEVLEINSEIDLFLAVERWAKSECVRKGLDPADSKSLRSVVESALTKIRFLTLTPQEFAEGPGRSPLLMQNEAFSILMNISSSDSKWPMPEGFCTNSQIRIKPQKSVPSMIENLRLRRSAAGIISTSDSGSSISIVDESLQNCITSNFICSTSSLPQYQSRVPMNAAELHLNSLSSLSSNTSIVEGGLREGPKYYCLRDLIQQTDCLNTSVLDCSVTFNVDRNICVIGVQVPTQVSFVNLNIPPGMPSTVAAPESYTEVLYAHLLDSDGSRLTYTHFTTKVNLRSLVEITFNRPVYIQKNKIYRVGVVFNKVGWYPMGVCSQRMSCDSVFFSFGVGNSADSIRDGLIRSIVFSYH